MAKIEIDELEPRIAEMEENIKLLLILRSEDDKNAIVESEEERAVMKLLFLQAIYSRCIIVIVKLKAGKWR